MATTEYMRDQEAKMAKIPATQTSMDKLIEDMDNLVSQASVGLVRLRQLNDRVNGPTPKGEDTAVESAPGLTGALRHRMSTLEGILGTMAHELDQLEGAL